MCFQLEEEPHDSARIKQEVAALCVEEPRPRKHHVAAQVAARQAELKKKKRRRRAIIPGGDAWRSQVRNASKVANLSGNPFCSLTPRFARQKQLSGRALAALWFLTGCLFFLNSPSI